MRDHLAHKITQKYQKEHFVIIINWSLWPPYMNTFIWQIAVVFIGRATLFVSLFAPVHRKSWPNVKSGQVGVSLNLLIRICRLVHWKSHLVIICPNSREKLTKSEIRSSWKNENDGCFRPPLCTLFRLNWAKQTPGIMRRN